MPRIAIDAFDAMGAFAAVHESESGMPAKSPRPWQGDATGEKGHLWSDEPSAAPKSCNLGASKSTDNLMMVYLVELDRCSGMSGVGCKPEVTGTQPK